MFLYDKMRSWIHAPSGRVYSYSYQPPKVKGKDDVTGEDLIQRDDDKPDCVRQRLAQYDETTAPLVDFYEKKGVLKTFQGTMEVWKKAVDRARKENPDGYKNGGNVFGVGLLLGYLCLLHGKENGCIDAEFLAIDDEEYQHKRLVRYYKNSGFKVIKYVGEDIGDIPDRLVWGGCGTLMREKVDVLLEKWTKNLFRRRSAAE